MAKSNTNSILFKGIAFFFLFCLLLKVFALVAGGAAVIVALSIISKMR